MLKLIFFVFKFSIRGPETSNEGNLSSKCISAISFLRLQMQFVGFEQKSIFFSNKLYLKC